MEKMDNIQPFLYVLSNEYTVKEMFSSGDYCRRVVLPKWELKNPNEKIDKYNYIFLDSEIDEEKKIMNLKMSVVANDEKELCGFLDALTNYYSEPKNDEFMDIFPENKRYNIKGGYIIDVLLIVYSPKLRKVPEYEENIYYEHLLTLPVREVL